MSEVLTLAQAAEQVDRDPSTVRHWVKDERLDVMRVGRRVFTTAGAVREAERLAWLNDPRTGPVASTDQPV